jgi:hypothetical protein
MFSIIYIVETEKPISNVNAVITPADIDSKDLVLKSNIVRDNKVIFTPINVKPVYYQKLLPLQSPFSCGVLSNNAKGIYRGPKINHDV